MKRAVQQTRKLLQEAGHTIVPFAPPKIDYMVDELFTRGIFSDGAAHLVDSFKGDIVDPNLKSQFNTYKLPALVKRILAIILKPIVCQKPLGSAYSCGAATSYTNLYNVLNFPAGVVPVSTVTRADEEELKHYRGHYEDPWDKRLKEGKLCLVAILGAHKALQNNWYQQDIHILLGQVTVLLQYLT